LTGSLVWTALTALEAMVIPFPMLKLQTQICRT
jgi:hypothetical protein